MEINFSIEYRTQWGEELGIIGSIPIPGEENQTFQIPLTTQDGINWMGKINFDIPPRAFQYEYAVFKEHNILRKEANRQLHQFDAHLFNENIKHIEINDTWHLDDTKNVYFHTVFNSTWYSNNPPSRQNTNTNLVFEIFYPMLKADERLAVVGNQKILGNWNHDQAVEVNSSNYPYYYLQLDNNHIEYPLEYKYVIIDKDSKLIKYWETNNNRYLHTSPLEGKEGVKISEGVLTFNEHPNWKGAGLAVPIFSLKSKRSWGIGEFLDLIPLTDWASNAKLNLIQVLPINDTTSELSWADSYPYKCSSVFALNPVYLNLEEAGIAKTKYKDEYFKQIEQLNENRFVDFPYVQKKKLTYIKELFQVLGEELLSTPEFCTFYNNNQEWLLPYANYIYFRNHYQTDNIEFWEGHSIYSKEVATQLYTHNNKATKAFQLTFFTQYLLFSQLKKSAKYAQSKGIALKGDLPIGISKQSVDAWQFPKLFNLNSQAGAPPDAFAEQGQNWGFPTYNWHEMSLDNYCWWQNRLKHMANFYQAYRIDHILGFFRIWSIPDTATYGTLGQFDPAMPLSAEEIEQFGFPFDCKLYTEPYITEEILNKLFDKEELTLVYKQCLNYQPNGCFEFKPEFDTQKKIVAKKGSFKDAILSKLCELHSYVLFVVDDKDQERYHPRIDAKKTPLFQQLSEQHQHAFMELYNHFFYHRHNEFWKEEAYKKLPALIQASDMLVCGEDLGMIPATVPEVMNNLSILSLEVARMPKEVGLEMGNPRHYPYNSVSTFATHDMSTLRGWWSENKELRTFISDNYTDLGDTSSDEITTEQALKLISLELNGGSMLCVEALQDWLSLTDDYKQLSPLEEQINIPADSKHKWRYRMPCNIEDLQQNAELIDTISKVIKQTNRS